MALTVSDVMERARDRYNATGDKFFSDGMLRGLIFSAQEELAKKGWVIENTLDTTSESGVRTITWPENTLAIKEVRYKGVKIYKVTLSADPKTSNSDPLGTPGAYAVWDNTIILYPGPADSGDDIQVKVYSYPQDVTSNTSPLEVPQEYRDDLINYLLAHMFAKDQNDTFVSFYINRWDETVNEANKQRAKRLRADRSARVKDEYFGTDIPYTSRGGVYYGW